jgi:hypothetical protein
MMIALYGVVTIARSAASSFAPAYQACLERSGRSANGSQRPNCDARLNGGSTALGRSGTLRDLLQELPLNGICGTVASSWRIFLQH